MIGRRYYSAIVPSHRWVRMRLESIQRYPDGEMLNGRIPVSSGGTSGGSMTAVTDNRGATAIVTDSSSGAVIGGRRIERRTRLHVAGPLGNGDGRQPDVG